MNKGTLDLVTIGDSTVDTFIKIHDATVACDINREACTICVPYGSKIPVDAIAYSVAGNAANVAVGAARLGLATAIYTNLGDDDQGKTIKATLLSAGVSDQYIKVNPGYCSNLSVVLTFQGERTIFVYHQDWSYRLPHLAKATWVYLTSMAKTFTNSNIMDEVFHYVIESGVKLVFGPGTYQLQADIKRFRKILEHCELLIVNMEEAKTILEVDPREAGDPKDLLCRLLLLGPKNAVITGGAEGSFATDGARNFKLGIFPTQVIDKTGAGDAYSSGLVAALHYSLPLSEAMVWGTINASHEIQEVGTQKGIMNKEDLERHRKAVPEFVAVPF
ncbi:carbohydrate kinase family protein [Candidatus Curtissbacteria bacterium]|nr:carbohydrate kinase family protein [Candidatus Curtissbacteria bacterium]